MSSSRPQTLPPAAREVLQRIVARLRRARDKAEAAARDYLRDDPKERTGYALGAIYGVVTWVADDLDRLLTADSEQLTASRTTPKKGRAQ